MQNTGEGRAGPPGPPGKQEPSGPKVQLIEAIRTMS